VSSAEYIRHSSFKEPHGGNDFYNLNKTVAFVKMGVPGRSKACRTCKARKVKVSQPALGREKPANAPLVGSVTTRSPSAADAS
jgi:hypothetical protein